MKRYLQYLRVIITTFLIAQSIKMDTSDSHLNNRLLDFQDFQCNVIYISIFKFNLDLLIHVSSHEKKNNVNKLK